MSDNHFKIRLDDKPNLQRALANDPERAKEVIATFVGLIEESLDEQKGIAWSKLAEELAPELSFRDLVTGILRGALDIRDLNPETFDVLKVEVHPLSILTPRKNYIDGGMKYYDWRDHFHLPSNAPVNAKTVEDIIRKMFRYTRYVDVKTLQDHLQANQITTYRGLGDEQVKKLPLYPALRYQKETFGDLHVGKFYDDIGFFDCGANDEVYCLACNRYELQRIGNYKCCLSCNAGYVESKGGEVNVTGIASATKN